jgi:hypothetical protein
MAAALEKRRKRRRKRREIDKEQELISKAHAKA